MITPIGRVKLYLQKYPEYTFTAPVFTNVLLLSLEMILDLKFLHLLIQKILETVEVPIEMKLVDAKPVRRPNDKFAIH